MSRTYTHAEVLKLLGSLQDLLGFETEAEEIHDMEDAFIKRRAAVYDEHYVAALTQVHSGDCTKTCGPCVRCIAEQNNKTSERLIKLILG